MKKRTIGALLAISLLPMTTGVVASAMPQLAATFPTAKMTTLNLVVTMPSFAMMVGVICSGWLVQRFGSKRLVLTGLGLVTMATVLAATAPNLTWLLAARLLLGAGLGLYNTLAVSLISRLFTGNQRQQLLGYQNATQGLGALVGALAVAGLLMLNWRWAFLIYLISGPILVAYAAWVPEVTFNAKVRSAPLTKAQWYQVGYDAGALFLLMTFYMLANLKLPTLFVQRHLGSASTGALLLAVMALGTVVAGMSYQLLVRYWAQWRLVISSGLMLMGYLSLAWSASWGLVVSASLIGVSFGWFVPTLFGDAAKVVTGAQANLVTMILMISSNLANFTASFALLLLAPHGQLNTLIWRSGVVLVLISVVELLRWWHLRATVVSE